MTLSPFQIRHYVQSFGAASDATLDRQLAIHVAAGHFTEADAAAIRRGVVNSDARLMSELVDLCHAR